MYQLLCRNLMGPSYSDKDRKTRDQIKQELVKNFSDALKAAETMSSNWYKTQTLTEVALYCKGPKQQLIILNQALASALLCRDENRIVTISC